MSEIVDPIVVTPEKELQTPEFFKKDIERISGEVFDKKIVDVPSGTKLYKHQISDGVNNTLYLISTKSTAYLFTAEDNSIYIDGIMFSLFLINNPLITAKIIVSGGGGAYKDIYNVLRLAASGPYSIDAYYSSSSNKTITNQTNYLNLTDTVTEL